MPGRIPTKAASVDLQLDSNSFEDDGEFANPDIDPHFVPNPDQEPTSPPYSLYIPPKASGVKRKKQKKQRRHSETIWTIVSEQENHHHQQSKQRNKEKEGKSKSVTVTPLGSPSSSAKELNKSQKNNPPPKKTNKKEQKKGKSKKPEGEDNSGKPSFLDNPVFQSDLKNWTLPRAELWCKDPSCQINIRLWREYCRVHHHQLAHLQVQELQQQQYLYNYPPHQHHYQQHNQRHHQFLQQRQSDPLILPPDLPPPASLSRRQRLNSISLEQEPPYSQARGASSTSSAGAGRQCNHPFHQGEDELDEPEVFYRQVLPQLHHPLPYPHHGHMQISMTLNQSMNNLSSSGRRQEANSSPSKNIMPASSGKTSTSAPSTGGKITPSSGLGESVPSSRENFSSSSSSSHSSTSSSSEDVSSGSTFVTGFDSSDSRGSSVPSSLNKPPNIMDHQQHQHSHNHHNKNSNSNNRSSTLNNGKSYGESAAPSGYPSLPYMPSGYRKPGICPSCNGLVPSAAPSANHHLVVPVDPMVAAAGGGGVGVNGVTGPGPLDIIGGPLHHHHNNTNNLKSDNNAFWNFTKFQHPLQRDHSFHSVGGFTLNGQYNTQVKKRRMVKFCSSHKIALVVSTFSLMVTIGLIITLILMKKRGMMDTMDMMPT